LFRTSLPFDPGHFRRALEEMSLFLRQFNLCALKCTLILGMLCRFVNVSTASHIIGGSIHYEIISGNTYEITLTLYRDCSSDTQYDDPASIGIFDSSGDLVYNLEIDVADAIINDVEAESYNACFMAPLGLCVEEAIYTGTAVLPPVAGGYTLTYQRCCRNFSIVNVPTGTDVGITLTTEIPGPELVAINANPEFATHPPLVVCLNAPFVFNHAATDADGDQLVYEFCAPLNTNVNGSYINPPGAPPYNGLSYNAGYSPTYPIDASPAFAINPNSGLITGTPTSLGQFVFGVCIHEYRNGILINTTNRDFQLNVTVCDPVDSPVIASQENICSGLTVEFSNESLNEMTFFWDFGVDEISTDTSNLFEPSYTYAEPGNYEIMLVMNPGLPCADTTYATYISSPDLEPAIAEIVFACQENQLLYQLIGTGGTGNETDFLWEIENEEGISVFNEAVLHDLDLGEHGETVQLTFSVSEVGCTESISQTIEIPEAVIASIVPQSTFCDGFGYQFENSSVNATMYSWNFGESGSSSMDIEPFYMYSDTGLFHVRLIAQAESLCPDTAYIDMLIYGLLDPWFEAPASQCLDGNQFDFEAMGASTNIAIYDWDFGESAVPLFSNSSTPSGIHFLEEGFHLITLTIAENDCLESYIDSVEVIRNPVFGAEADTTEGCGTVTAVFHGTSVYEYPVQYVWDFGDGTLGSGTNPSHEYTSAGIYDVSVVASTSNGCPDSANILLDEVVIVHPNPIAGFEILGSSDDFIESYIEVTSVATGAVASNYFISDGTTYNAFDFTHEFTQSGIITITQTVESEYGCVASAVGAVIINGYVFYAPNSFTPNNDDVNDVWIPSVIGAKTYHLQIYNRWGEMIFETTDHKQPWIGEVHGGEYYAPDGVYVYNVVIEDLVGLPHDFRGHITLFR
jgi:gliding motility-associated-like protein